MLQPTCNVDDSLYRVGPTVGELGAEGQVFPRVRTVLLVDVVATAAEVDVFIERNVVSRRKPNGDTDHTETNKLQFFA